MYPTCLYFQVFFEAERLSGSWSLGHNNGLVFIDDIVVDIRSTCPVIPPDATPDTGSTISPTTAGNLDTV